jgi:hypothetical protein
MLKITLAILVALITGCATQSTLTVSSQPSGAQITEIGTGTTFGVAPVVLRYDEKELSKRKDASGCYIVNGLRANWVSGATTSSETRIRLCGSRTGDYTYHLSRDMSAEGLDKDLDFAMRQSAVSAQQAQAQAASRQADAQLFNLSQQLLLQSQPRVLAPPIAPPSQMNCVSRKQGNQVITNCN